MQQSIKTVLVILLTALIATTPLAIEAQDKLSNDDVEDAITNQFKADHVVNANKVRVEVHDGIVELTGKVSNIMAKERSARLAEMVKGVQAISNRIEVDPLITLAPTTIKANVEGALFADPATDSYEIDVSVQNQVATLSGTVDSYQEKMLCEYVAKSATGVADVKNAIKVNFDPTRPDLVMEKEIKAALKWDETIEDDMIEVEVDQGFVTLSGTVGSASEKTAARLTAWISGVKSVDNSDLKVQWWIRDDAIKSSDDAMLSDSEIEEAITIAAAYDPRVKSFNIDPESNLGIVTLTGNVDNLKAKKAAENLAHNTVGVVQVVNKLKVESDKFWTDSDIQTSIENSLANNSIVFSLDIDVEVIDGNVYLSGTVDNQVEKNEAEWVASGHYGVQEVVNNLVVNQPSAIYWYSYYPYYTYDFQELVKPNTDFSAEQPNDEKIEKAINRQIWWSPFVNADQVNVDVEKGVATLQGTVDSYREESAAIENAWEGGAWTVVNKLEVDSN